jgi:hypothetical protein
MAALRCFVFNRLLALVSAAVLGACAGPSPDDRLPLVSERNRGNATVRAVAYVEAASNVAAPAPVLTPEVALTSKTASTRSKQDKRAGQASRKDKPSAAPTAAATRQGSSLPEHSGRAVAQNVSLAATGYRYTYAVELDAGGTRMFGFATDQRLHVGDRVAVNSTGILSLSK